MKGKMVFFSIFYVLVFLLALPAISSAEIQEGVTTQGEFALWLVKAAGAQSKLPAAATGQDAIDFLTSLGVIPEEGWKEDEPITMDFLASLLGKKDTEGLSFDELVAKVQDYVRMVFTNRNLGVFRATSSASASTPAS